MLFISLPLHFVYFYFYYLFSLPLHFVLLSGQDSEADLVVLTRVLKAQELNRDLEVATRELQNYLHFCLP